MKRSSGLIPLLACASLASAAGLAAPDDKVAVLVTQWGEAEGFDHVYRRDVTARTYGERTESPGQPCTDMHVGTFPFQSQLGMLPYALAFPVKGLEGAYDSLGFYYMDHKNARFVSVIDPNVTVAFKDLPETPGLVIPAVESKSRTQRSIWGIDPRTGFNYIGMVWQIGASAKAGQKENPLAYPNGIRDLDEISYVAGISDMHILYDDLTPRFSPAIITMEKTVKGVLNDLFGSQVDVRVGSYAPTEGISPVEEDVAVAFAREGFRKMVIARETTDNNNYANNFMSLGYVKKGLCKAGFENQVEFQQVRQIGRAPEYNWALMQTLKPHLENLAPGSEVTILYATYGLPWPGGNPTGPFAQPHPWAKEVYHENAYNNYVAFKRYAEDWYGKRWKLNFHHAGKSGDRRPDSYFGYGMYKPDLLQDYGLYKEAKGQDLARENRFMTLREQVDLAKTEGRKELVILLSHWYENGRDPMLAVRTLQEFPLNSRADIRKGKYWNDWCEVAGATAPVDCQDPEQKKKPGFIHIQYSEAFDKVAKEVSIGYAQRLRGGVERFGVLPASINVSVEARGPVTRLGGGDVRVAEGRLRGARLQVAADAHPGWPEEFDWKKNEMFTDPGDNFVSAWDDFEAYIGQQDVPLKPLGKKAKLVSEAVLVGPYRTIVNRPATITLPFTGGKVRPGARPWIYNDATGDWDPVYLPAGSKPVRYDAAAGTASFDVQVFGVFALAVPR